MIRPAPEPLPAAEEPLVSIVVPVYEGEAFLAEALESALAQSYRRLEIVVSDNGSRDRSAAIAEDFARRDPRVRVVRADEVLGIRDNWNRAIRLVSPESRYVKVLCADDLLMPDGVARQVALAVRHPTVTLVSGYRFDGELLSNAGLPLTTSVAPGREIARRALLGGSHVFGAPPNVLYRADRVRAKVEFFGPPFFANFDDAACLELLEEGDFGFVHEVVSWSRVQPEQETSRVYRLREWEAGDLALLARYGPRFLTPAELRRRLRVVSGRYGWMLSKKSVKGRTWRDAEFSAYHAESLARITRELSTDGRPLWAATTRTVGGVLGVGNRIALRRARGPRADAA